MENTNETKKSSVKKDIPPLIKNEQINEFPSLSAAGAASFRGELEAPKAMDIDYTSRPDFISFTSNVMSPDILRTSANTHRNLLVIHDGIGADLFWRAENEGMGHSSDYKMHRIGTCHIWNRHYPEISYTDPLFLCAIEDTICDYQYGAVVISLMYDSSVTSETNNSALEKILCSVRRFNPDCELYFLVLQGMENRTGTAEDLICNYNGKYINYTGKDTGDFIDDFSKLLDKQKLTATPCSCCASDETVRLREAQGWVNYGFRDAGKRRKAPRLLLIGDSISHGYEPYVCSLLPEMTVDFVQTSYCMGDVALIRQINRAMSQYSYDIIHIAIGLHYSGIGCDALLAAWEATFNHIKRYQPEAKIIAALATTCSRPDELLINLDNNIIKTNKVLSTVAAKFGITTIDLYSICLEQQLPKIDTVHFAPEGYNALAIAVADAVTKELQR